MGDLGLVCALVTVGYMVGVWTGALVFRQRQRAYEDAVPATLSSPPVIVISNPERRGRQTLITRPSLSQQRLQAFDWRGPPELVIAARGISEHERRLITALALQRPKTVRIAMDLAQAREHHPGQSL
jgi:hypothetical protein